MGRFTECQRQGVEISVRSAISCYLDRFINLSINSIRRNLDGQDPGEQQRWCTSDRSVLVEKMHPGPFCGCRSVNGMAGKVRFFVMISQGPAVTVPFWQLQFTNCNST